jgi:hypothetical protein
MTKQGVHDRFFSLLKQIPGAEKEALVWQYSGMLTTSLREFYAKRPEDYKRMIADLQVKINASARKGSPDPEVKMLRSSILHRLQKHGVDTTNWTCVNTFLQQPRIAGKMLFEMSAAEMKSLIPKLESILAKDTEKRTEEIKMTERN